VIGIACLVSAGVLGLYGATRWWTQASCERLERKSASVLGIGLLNRCPEQLLNVAFASETFREFREAADFSSIRGAEESILDTDILTMTHCFNCLENSNSRHLMNN
jgi:hypothetical protein